MAGFDHIKGAMRDQRKAETRAAREQRKRQRRCWWTRPFGHEYVELADEDGREHKVCVSCEKPYPSATATPLRHK